MNKKKKSPPFLFLLSNCLNFLVFSEINFKGSKLQFKLEMSVSTGNLSTMFFEFALPFSFCQIKSC